MKTTKQQNYWISWKAPHDIATKLALSFPWWVSGEATRETILCGAVQAGSVHDAKQAVLTAYKVPPNGLNWRRCHTRRDEWTPFNDRFKRAEWMEWTPLRAPTEHRDIVEILQAIPHERFVYISHIQTTITCNYCNTEFDFIIGERSRWENRKTYCWTCHHHHFDEDEEDERQEFVRCYNNEDHVFASTHLVITPHQARDEGKHLYRCDMCERLHTERETAKFVRTNERERLCTRCVQNNFVSEALATLENT